MLTVIIDARDGAGGLATLLAQLTAGAVDGIVREVLIVAAPESPDIDLLCEEMGAEAHTSLAAAGEAARSERVLVLPPGFRFRDGWIGALNSHLAAGGSAARVIGLGAERRLSRAPEGVLVVRSALAGAEGADLKRLRRVLGQAWGVRARRIG
jgi:hypothetical protein